MIIVALMVVLIMVLDPIKRIAMINCWHCPNCLGIFQGETRWTELRYVVSCLGCDFEVSIALVPGLK